MVLKKPITCKVNQKEMKFEAYPMERVLDVLREAGLTGTKEGCGEGECGACSIVVDGRLVNSCLIPVTQLEGADVQTIEGVAQGETLHALQKAFIECNGAQCGICTPGMIMAALQLLKESAQPNEEEIREGLGGNLCRCTGYNKIIQSVVQAVQQGASS